MSEDDQVAVVGLSCRVPGADDAPAMWRNLLSGVDSVRRLTAAEGAPTDPDWVPVFGRLDDLDGFDADLFGYPAELAALLDPQHRLFLEVAWRALEDAGIDPDRDPAQVGVFAGCGPNRYLHHHLLGNPALKPGSGGLAEDWDDALTGSGCDYLPTRTAYALGLAGPAVAIQTACSTSLVAVCQAAQSLLDYRCDVAIAGGSAVVSTRQAGYRLRPGGLLATDGVCRPYDGAATGQVFGNGAGAVVLKRLADACADGDHVYAVLAGWAVNNDGADRPGFTVPGVAGQAAVLAEALASVGWGPADVGYVEGHGTGTPVGDAIEVDALTRVRRGGRSPLLLGSVKGNLGNLDAAAGVVSLIKAVYAVHTGQVPGTAHFTGAHRDVDLAVAGAEVSAQTRPWAGQRRAGVSSFGLGGTNAHVLVERAPGADDHDDADGPAGEPGQDRHDRMVLGLSAGSPAALRELARRLAERLAVGDLAVADVAHTLAVGRRRLAYRGAVGCADAGEAVGQLTALAQGGPVADDAAARCWLDGGELPVMRGRRVPLPGYPFQRTRHWIEAGR
jgi:acyl transferase domain-containing protein